MFDYENSDEQPTAFMLVGVPCSGKSHFVDSSVNEFKLISTDEYIEQCALATNKTYSELFNNKIKPASAQMYLDLKGAIDKNENIVWDQTNCSVKSRAKKLAMIPDNYRKIAVFFETPEEEELERRLNNRPGKIIPEHVMKSMIANLEIPTDEEGFDAVIYVCYDEANNEVEAKVNSALRPKSDYTDFLTGNPPLPAGVAVCGNDTTLHEEVAAMFYEAHDEAHDPKADKELRGWLANPSDWHVTDVSDGEEFEETIEYMVQDDDPVPVAVAVLRPQDLEAQVIYAIFEEDGVLKLGEHSGD